VIAVVVVIGIVMASMMVKVGYTAMHSGALSGPARPTVVAPVPAARTSPTGDAETGATDPGEAETGATDPGEAESAGAAGVSSRQPGVSPRADQVYLTAMRQRPAFSGSGDAELFGLGRSTCGQLDRGQSFMSIVTAGGDRGLQAEDMGYLTAISVMAYCPRHKPMLEKLIGQSLPSI
jgi:hypothetical protein